MPLSDIVAVNISTLTAGVTQAGFGIPLILSHTATWVERTRTYSSAVSVSADFAVTTPEYLAAARAFSQTPAPAAIMVGRAASAVAQSFSISVSAVANLTKYPVRIGATTYTFTSDSTATHDEITAGITALVTGITGLTATNPGTSGSKTIKLVAGAGLWFDVEILDVTLMSIAQDHADPGVTTDLNAIITESQLWYALETLYNSAAYIAACAAWAEANQRLYIAQSVDTAIIAVADVSATDIAHTLKASAFAWTGVVYHPSTGAFLDAGWLGACLPLDPGSETWKFKTVAGVPVVNLTGTHLVNLKAKHCNYYYNVAGQNMTAEGVTASGEFIDVVRFRDWLKARMQERIFARLKNAKKISFTDKGLVVIENEIRGQLTDGIEAGGLAEDPAPTVFMPKVAAQSLANRTARSVQGIKFTCVLAGAVHNLVINGTITI